MMLKVGSLVAISALVAVACGKKDDDKKDEQTTGEAGQVEEIGLKPEKEVPSEEEIAKEEEENEAAAKAVEGAGSCEKSPCFTLNDYKLGIGQVKVATVADGQTKFSYLTGFQGAENRSILQGACLNETAAVMKEFAEENPNGLKDFADAGFVTNILARVYDYSADSTLDTVDPSFYLHVKSKKQSEGLIWVVRASVHYSDDGELTCTPPTKEDITKGLQAMKDRHLSQD